MKIEEIIANKAHTSNIASRYYADKKMFLISYSQSQGRKGRLVNSLGHNIVEAFRQHDDLMKESYKLLSIDGVLFNLQINK